MERKKRCPYCGEEIMEVARKCRYCGEWLNDEVKQKMQFETSAPKVELMKNNIIEDSIKKDKYNQQKSLLRSCFLEQISEHYCDFKGSVDRKTFWIFYLYYALLSVFLNGVSEIVPLIGMIMQFVVWFGLLLPCLGLCVRRLHDIMKKWTWIFIILIPIVGPIWFIWLMAEGGDSQNSNGWTTKDIILTIVLAVVGLGLFFLPSSSNSTGGVDKTLLGDLYEDLDKAELESRFQDVGFGMIASGYPFCKYMGSELKCVYDIVISKEQEWGVECECLEIIRQMDSEYSTIEPSESYLLGTNEAVVFGSTDFRNYPNKEVAMQLTFERDDSFFSQRKRINKVLISDVVVLEEDWSLLECMMDWLESKPFLENTIESDALGNEQESVPTEMEREINEQVVAAFNTGSIEDIMTAEFTNALKATLETMDDGFIPSSFSIEDFYYSIGPADEVGIKGLRMLDDGRIKITVDLLLWFDYESEMYAKWDNTLILVRDETSSVFNSGKTKWLVDDIVSDTFSYKTAMIRFASNPNQESLPVLE